MQTYNLAAPKSISVIDVCYRTTTVDCWGFHFAEPLISRLSTFPPSQLFVKDTNYLMFPVNPSEPTSWQTALDAYARIIARDNIWHYPALQWRSMNKGPVTPTKASQVLSVPK